MKRYFSFALAFLILGISLAAPARAAEVDSNSMVNILEYASANDSGSNYFSAGSGNYTATAVYSPINQISYVYVDLLVASVSGKLGSATCNGSALTVLEVSSRLFRVYGSVTTTRNFTLEFTSTTANVKYTILEFDAASVASLSYAETGQVLYQGTYYSMENADTALTVDIGYIYYEDNSPISFSTFTFLDDYKKYDSYDVFFVVKAYSLNSIRVIQGDQDVPFTVNYLASTGTDYEVIYPAEDGQVTPMTTNPTNVSYYISIRIDMTQVDRSSSSAPGIAISGTYLPWYESTLTLTSVTGRVVYEGASAAYVYFHNLMTNLDSWFEETYSGLSISISNLKTAIVEELVILQQSLATNANRIISAINGDSTSGDQFKEDSSGLISDLDDISASMDSVERPAMDSIDTDYSADISDASTLMVSIFSQVTGVSWLSRIILASVTIGLISYILYGKE